MASYNIENIKPPFAKGRVHMIIAEDYIVISKFNVIVEANNFVLLELVKVSNQTVPIKRIERVDGKDIEIDTGKTRRRQIVLAKFKEPSYTHKEKINLSGGERLILRSNDPMPVYSVNVSYSLNKDKGVEKP